MTDAASREIPMLFSKSPARRSLKVAAAVVLAAAAGCLPRNDFTGGIPQDYRQRHAIGLMQANHTLEVFVSNNGGRLDHRQTEDVRSFGRDYMQNGQGPLVAYLPSGGTGAVGQGLDNIRRALAGGGASGRLQIAHYPAGGGAAPIKLVFAKLKADTTTTCGYQDEDIVPVRGLAVGSNSQNYNFGCAYQKNLAAQIADPRDLLRPRQEGPIDVDRRLAGIERLRETETNPIAPQGTSLRKLIPE
jgi:pilus assembly protein CpaD